MIDLRSDTVTLPSPAMREAIRHAVLGDDVYGEDPTVAELEQQAAALVGMEAAVLVVSGTMGNLSALLAHCTRGQRVIVGSESHIYHYEAGGASALGGLVYHPIPNHPDGTLDPIALGEALIDKANPHFAPPGVVCLENTHNRCGGVVLTPDYVSEVAAQAHTHGLPVHLDGARICNAAVALGVEVHMLTAPCDSVQWCLSKGLAAPVGSLVAGSAAFIAEVRRIRKMLGGGMRQAGVIAAAGIVALQEMIPRLAEDHAHARQLAEGLAELGDVVEVDRPVQSNIVIFRPTKPGQRSVQVRAALREHGILIDEMHGCGLRAVPHYGITTDDIHTVLATLRKILLGR